MIQVNEIRKNIFQSPGFKLADTELNDYIKAMTTLLTDPTRLATDALAMQAVVQLQRVFYYVNYDVRSCLLVGKCLSQKQRKTIQNIHHVLQIRYVLYTRYKSGTIAQVKNAANGNQNIICAHPLLTRPIRPYSLWKEVQNANSKIPANTSILHSILHQVSESTTKSNH